MSEHLSAMYLVRLAITFASLESSVCDALEPASGSEDIVVKFACEEHQMPL